MNLFTGVATLIALCLFLNNLPAQTLLEKRVVGDIQRTLASDLDSELPNLPFADWFEKVIGRGTGVIWQLSECGGPGEASLNATGDIPACVEANTILPDGRRVIVMINVGTFKKGVTGPPAFNFGVIEQHGELRSIRRLCDLQKQLLAPEKLAAMPPVILPEVNLPSVMVAPYSKYLAKSQAWGGEDFGRFVPIEDTESPPPSPTQRAGTKGGLRQGMPIVKPQPAYPRNNNAKRFNAAGNVEVQVTISVTGRVTDAKALSGHPLLREAAVQAARRWEFEPTLVDGIPTETQLTLIFTFTVPPE